MTGPQRPPARIDPARFRLAISLVLTFGVSTAAGLVGVGLVGALVFGWNASLAGSQVAPAPTADFTAMASNLAALRPIGIAQAGLLVLLATPVMRVAAALIGFAIERDPIYVAVSAAVLAVLVMSLVSVR